MLSGILFISIPGIVELCTIYLFRENASMVQSLGNNRVSGFIFLFLANKESISNEHSNHRIWGT